MKKEGYPDSTIRGAVKSLRALARHVNILEPEAVRQHLAVAEQTEARKEKLTDDLARFYRFKNIPFNRPRYQRVEKLSFIPLKRDIDALISAVDKNLSTFSGR